VKSYVGHSLACAAGDQIMASLGVWNDGIIPGIITIENIADDVFDSHLRYLLQHEHIDPLSMDTSFINSKGFGGNNATAAILAPHVVHSMMEKRHGKAKLLEHARLNESVHEKARQYDDDAIAGVDSIIYQFGAGVIEGQQLGLSPESIKIPGHKQKIDLNVSNPFEDMT